MVVQVAADGAGHVSDGVAELPGAAAALELAEAVFDRGDQLVLAADTVHRDREEEVTEPLAEAERPPEARHELAALSGLEQNVPGVEREHTEFSCDALERRIVLIGARRVRWIIRARRTSVAREFCAPRTGPLVWRSTGVSSTIRGMSVGRTNSTEAAGVRTVAYGLAPGALDEEVDVQSEEMLVNMGPQHPSTHGVLRIVLRTDGEVVLEAVPVARALSLAGAAVLKLPEGEPARVQPCHPSGYTVPVAGNASKVCW